VKTDESNAFNGSDAIGGWQASALGWIEGQGEEGDASRREILDPCLDTLMFPSVKDKKVLDVGCGEGRYCRKLARQGAIVTGIDPVDLFIERAKTLHPEGDYRIGFGEALPFENLEFDIVLSYLALVDIPDYKSAIDEMSRVLRPGGSVFYVTVSNMASTSDGWVKDSEGNRLYRTVDRYMEDFSMHLNWLCGITNYHRPLSAILDRFFKNGLVMDSFHEPLPPKTSSWYREEFRCPTFQIMRFKKN
jgi:SAM-dependent methyltransferase